MVPALIKTTFFHTTSHNPAGWGAFFELIHLDLYGPVGSLPSTVAGSNNTAELQAPLEAIAFMMLHPPHIIFHLGSQYVLDLLSGVALPSTNLELTILLLDFFHYLQSNSYVELRKVKSHTGITGNDRADSNASKGVTSRSPIGRFSTFSPSPLPSLPFPQIQQHTISLIEQLPTSPPDIQKSLCNKINKSSKLGKKKMDPFTLVTSDLLLTTGKTIKRIRSKYQPRTQSVYKPDGTPCLKSENYRFSPSIFGIMFGIFLKHSQTLSKIPLHHHNQTSTLRSQCLNSTMLSDEPKLVVPQVQIIAYGNTTTSSTPSQEIIPPRSLQ